MQKITVRLPEEMLRKIEMVAAESETNRSEVTRRMVQTWLEEKGALEPESGNPASNGKDDDAKVTEVAENDQLLGK